MCYGFLLFSKGDYDKDDLVIIWGNETYTSYDNGLSKAKHFRELNAYLIFNHTSECNKSEPDWRGEILSA